MFLQILNHCTCRVAEIVPKGLSELKILGQQHRKNSGNEFLQLLPFKELHNINGYVECCGLDWSRSG
jgi:hypothetical protein